MHLLRSVAPRTVFLSAFLAGTAFLAGQLLLPCLAASIDYSSETPDLMQSDARAALPDGGEQFCGPVAAMNSMVWLSRRGFSNLAMSDCDRPYIQGKIALKLSEEMKTTRRDGTRVTGFLNGLESYVLQKGYSIASLKYQGWERHPNRFDGGSEHPTLSLIKTGMATANTAVWLKIGWYRFFPDEDKFIRFAGHWVTVVGLDETVNPPSLLIHDPAPRSGKSEKHERVVLTPLTHGKISTGWEGDRLREAKGFYNLGGELKIKKLADCGLLDGVVVLTVRHENFRN